MADLGGGVGVRRTSPLHCFQLRTMLVCAVAIKTGGEEGLPPSALGVLVLPPEMGEGAGMGPELQKVSSASGSLGATLPRPSSLVLRPPLG